MTNMNWGIVLSMKMQLIGSFVEMQKFVLRRGHTSRKQREAQPARVSGVFTYLSLKGIWSGHTVRTHHGGDAAC